jgi:glycosyltransferase involved in cell wall biosynthesis
MVSPPRVLQVTDHLRAGGAERMVAGLVTALAGGGLARSVVCTGTDDADAAELRDLVDAASDEHVVLGHRRQYDPRIAARLAAVGRRHAVDVVHSHPGTLNPHAHVAARLLGVPHVTTLHTMPGPLTGNTPMRERADAWSGRRCTAVVVPAQTVAAAFAGRWRLARDRVRVIPNAVFANGLAAGDEPDPGASRVLPEGSVVLTAARLLRAKGLYDLVDAARIVTADRPDVRFAIAGDGPERDGLRAAVAAAGLEERVLLLGHRQDVGRLLGEAAVFCLPSHHEGVPLSLLEALAQGVPAVSTGVGGVVDAVRDGVDALVVPPHDPVALAGALGRVLDDPALARRLADGGRATAARDHTAALAAERYAALYRDLAARAA